MLLKLKRQQFLVALQLMRGKIREHFTEYEPSVKYADQFVIISKVLEVWTELEPVLL